MKKERQLVKLSLIDLNEGQVDWLPKNPRQWTKQDIDNTAASIERDPDFLEDRPLLLIHNGARFVVFGGNLRSQGCKKAGHDIVPAYIYTPETDEDRMTIKRRAMLDNGSFGAWDFDELANNWSDLPLADWGVPAWDTEEVNANPTSEVKEDDFDPDKKVESRVKFGDIWQLGRHRLMCGDSTKRADVEQLMGGGKADLTFTSPPYNGNNELGSGDVFQRKNTQRLYADGYSDDLPSAEYIKFASSVLEICFENTDGFIFWNVNYNSNSKYEYIAQIIPFLSKLIEQVVWKKSSAIPLKGCMRRGWEPVYIFSNTKKNLGTEVVETNIWEISNKGANGNDHKACFPIGLPSKGISLVKPKTGIVLDPFGGTGTTMIAAEQLNRKCYMMELDPHYCDVIIARWEKLTGKTAVKL